MGEAQKSYERGQVVEIIQSVIQKIERTDDPEKAIIHNQIAELADTIETLKKDITESLPAHLKAEAIPGATDELDAVVGATAEATHTIMEACEEMEKLADGLEGAAGGTIANNVTKIYEACGFQDITGQRITKVVAALKLIEEKIDGLMHILNLQVGPLSETAPSKPSNDSAGADEKDEALLNGPQLPDQAISQDEIDKLLADFD